MDQREFRQNVEQLANQIKEQRQRFSEVWDKVEQLGEKASKKTSEQPEQVLWSIVPFQN